jgi:hypothetical protein
MARINPVIVRLDDDQRIFLEKMAKKDVRPAGTLAYMAVADFLEQHGFSEWLEDKSSLDTKKHR